MALTSLGVMLREMRRFEDAVAAHREAAAAFREVGNQGAERWALENAQRVLSDQGRRGSRRALKRRAATSD